MTLRPLPAGAVVYEGDPADFCMCSTDHTVGINGNCPAGPRNHPGHPGDVCPEGWGDPCYYTPPCSRHAIPCDNYRHKSDRRGYSLGVYYTVPRCACGADRADHEPPSNDEVVADG